MGHENQEHKPLTIYLYVYKIWCVWQKSWIAHYGRKFRSQTSDNMDRWKEEMGRGREKSRREQIREEKEYADARKGRKVAKHCVFPMIWGSGGSKSRLAKAASAEPSGQMSDEKVHPVVGRSTFPSQNVQNTPGSDHFWKLRCRKSARRCGAKHISKSKYTKHTRVGPLSEVEMSKKCTPLWCEAHFGVKMYKTHQLRTTFRSCNVEKVHAVVARSTFRSQNVQNTPRTDHFFSFRVAGARDCAPSQKWGKREGFVALPKTMAGVGHLKRIFKDAFSVAGAVQETSSSEILGSQGADFLRRVAFWSIRSVGLLRWFCVTGAALRMTWHHFFVAGAVLSTGRVEKPQNALVRGCQLCTQLSIFEGSLAELICFWCCQIQKLKKSRRIASFLTLLSSKIEEVSQNCLVFDVVKFNNWGSLAE